MKWIKHDTDANQDNKLQNVLLDYGLEGYGLYWYCLELIGSKVDKDSITFELEHDSRVIARNTGSTAQKVEEMMRYFVTQRLFESTDNVITCLAMAKRLDKSMTSNPQMRDVIGSLGVNKTVKEGYVYFILNKNNNGEVIEVKVGRSANPSARFAEHKKKYEEFGFDLEMVKTIKTDDCIALETEIHRKLKDYQIRKEWFMASEQVIELLRHDYDVTTTCKIRLDKIRGDESIKDVGDKSPVPLQQVLDAYHELLPMMPVVLIYTEKRKSMVRTFWKKRTTEHKSAGKVFTIDSLRGYFNYIANHCQWMLTDRDNGKGGMWKAKNFDYVMKDDCYVAVKEQRFDNKGN